MSNRLLTDEFISVLKQLAKYRLQVKLPVETGLEISPLPLSLKQIEAVRLHNVLMRLRDGIHFLRNAETIECSPTCVCQEFGYHGFDKPLNSVDAYTRQTTAQFEFEAKSLKRYIEAELCKCEGMSLLR